MSGNYEVQHPTKVQCLYPASARPLFLVIIHCVSLGREASISQAALLQGDQDVLGPSLYYLGSLCPAGCQKIPRDTEATDEVRL